MCARCGSTTSLKGPGSPLNPRRTCRRRRCDPLAPRSNAQPRDTARPRSGRLPERESVGSPADPATNLNDVFPEGLTVARPRRVPRVTLVVSSNGRPVDPSPPNLLDARTRRAAALERVADVAAFAFG